MNLLIIIFLIVVCLFFIGIYKGFRKQITNKVSKWIEGDRP